MDVYATVSDVAARYRELDEDEAARVEALLVDTSARLTSLLNKSGVEIDPDDEVQAANLLAVTCAIVIRAINTSVDLTGLTNYTQTAGSYQASYTYANATGDLYLTTAEKKLLGIGQGRMWSIRPIIHDATGAEIDW